MMPDAAAFAASSHFRQMSYAASSRLASRHFQLFAISLSRFSPIADISLPAISYTPPDAAAAAVAVLSFQRHCRQPARLADIYCRFRFSDIH
jgi:hypothetical protein